MTKFRRILKYILDLESNPKRVPLSEEDLQLAAHLIDLGESIDKGEYVITTEERLQYSDDDSKDLGWTPVDEEYHKIKEYPDMVNLSGAPNLIQFSIGEFVELSKVKEAVEYYGSRQRFHNNGKKNRPSLATMCHRYRFIRNESHLFKLRQYELNEFTKSNRKTDLEFISAELEKEVKRHIEDGKILHDNVLRYLIADIIRKNNICIGNFVGSDSWLAGWKKRFGIFSRKITKFVSTVRHKTRDQIEKDSKDFVDSANQHFPLYHPSNIYNADQSGFQLEMNTARTLTFTGSKDVHCVVGSVSSTTHSYTVLPLISASGKMHPKLFINLKEPFPKADFPRKVFSKHQIWKSRAIPVTS